MLQYNILYSFVRFDNVFACVLKEPFVWDFWVASSVVC
jgi:hypothetical protein